jgi:F-type H+-transporting ATPase subunit delta
LILVSIARRYARALFEAAGDGYEAVGEELSVVARALGTNHEAAALFASPSTPQQNKRQMIEAVIAQGGTSLLLGNALRLLNDRGRIPYLGSIARAFRTMADDRSGRVRARVTSARPLTIEVEQRLAAALGRATRRNVTMETAVDPSTLGGVVAQVGNLLYDGSLRTQMENLRRELSRNPSTESRRT